MSISSERNPVDAILELLEGTDDTDYQDSKPPVIERIDESSGQTRVNRSQDSFYVYSPTDATVERISADGVAADSTEEVRVLIWVLGDAQKAKRFRQDVLDYLSTFMDDNTKQTGLNNIEPVAQADLRNEAQPRASSHSITGVTVSTDNYLRFD
jgi:hypothetical protein